MYELHISCGTKVFQSSATRLWRDASRRVGLHTCQARACTHSVSGGLAFLKSDATRNMRQYSSVESVWRKGVTCPRLAPGPTMPPSPAARDKSGQSLAPIEAARVARLAGWALATSLYPVTSPSIVSPTHAAGHICLSLHTHRHRSVIFLDDLDPEDSPNASATWSLCSIP